MSERHINPESKTFPDNKRIDLEGTEISKYPDSIHEFREKELQIIQEGNRVGRLREELHETEEICGKFFIGYPLPESPASGFVPPSSSSIGSEQFNIIRRKD